jgi:hypothetical protein
MSQWDAASLARVAAFREQRERAQEFQAAKRQHPLYGACDSLDDAASEASCREYWRFAHRDFGNGHQEANFVRVRPDPAAMLDRAIERDLRALAPRGEGDRDANIDRAVRRAKRDVRLKCKAMAVNSLWTLTYRENVRDREVVLRHLRAFRRRCAELLGGWRYVAVLEKQERGAWHVHLATHALPVYFLRGGVKLKSWDVMRGIWRSITRECGGNFDEAKRKARWGSDKAIKGAGKIAAYIAGYVAKDMREGELNRKRFSSSRETAVPRPYVATFSGDVPARELIELAVAAVGRNVTRLWWSPEREIFCIDSDDSGPS